MAPRHVFSLESARRDCNAWRHDVHLSAESKVTLQTGARHGKPALLAIRAGDMHRAGHVFRFSTNGVWLVKHVPPEFIDFSQAESKPPSRNKTSLIADGTGQPRKSVTVDALKTGRARL
jgi:hypothetical protein